jgi:hypothetical protein
LQKQFSTAKPVAKTRPLAQPPMAKSEEKRTKRFVAAREKTRMSAWQRSKLLRVCAPSAGALRICASRRARCRNTFPERKQTPWKVRTPQTTERLNDGPKTAGSNLHLSVSHRAAGALHVVHVHSCRIKGEQTKLRRIAKSKATEFKTTRLKNRERVQRNVPMFMAELCPYKPLIDAAAAASCICMRCSW